MDSHDVRHEALAAEFERHRPHLRAVAYRMLGSFGEAEDAVQEGWLRLSRTDTSDVANLAGWLTTVVSRVCLDQLRARTARREESLEVRMPDPIVTEDGCLLVTRDVPVEADAIEALMRDADSESPSS